MREIEKAAAAEVGVVELEYFSDFAYTLEYRKRFC